MSFREIFKTYRPGTKLGRGEKIIAASTVKRIDGPPGQLDETRLSQIAGFPPTQDERLILTPGYLVYKTDTQLLRLLKQGWVAGAKRYGTDLAAAIIGKLADFVDTTDRSAWIRWDRIRRVTALSIELTIRGRSLPFDYFEVETDSGPLWFLQVPVADRSARRQFSTMAAQLQG